MRHASILALVPAPVLALACGGSHKAAPDAPLDIGFNKPTMSLHANMQTGTTTFVDLGPADLSCLGTPSSDMPTTEAITLDTTVQDFQTMAPVVGAKVIAFPNETYTTPFDTETSDGSGNVHFTVPTGTERFGFEMTTTDGTTMPTFLLNQYLMPSMTPQTIAKIQSVSSETAQTLPALIDQNRTPGTGVLAGALRDCQNNEISNFVATVSSTSMTANIIPGADTYYFGASIGLPEHHCTGGVCASSQLDSASGDGLFMVIQLPASPTAYVQMWGYPTDADVQGGALQLIAQLQVPVLADTVITGSYVPLRQ